MFIEMGVVHLDDILPIILISILLAVIIFSLYKIN